MPLNANAEKNIQDDFENVIWVNLCMFLLISSSKRTRERDKQIMCFMNSEIEIERSLQFMKKLGELVEA
jgi:hypothetical protein